MIEINSMLIYLDIMMVLAQRMKTESELIMEDLERSSVIAGLTVKRGSQGAVAMVIVIKRPEFE